MKCVSRNGHLYEKVSVNKWKCVYCAKEYTFDDETKGWS